MITESNLHTELMRVIGYIKANQLVKAESVCKNLLHIIQNQGIELNKLGCDAFQSGR